MITHTWTVEKLESCPTLAGFENVVRRVFWVLISSDTSSEIANTVSSIGETELSFNPSISTFTDYSTLDEQTVISWVAKELGQEYLTGFEQAHEKTLLTAPLPDNVVIPLPWATN